MKKTLLFSLLSSIITLYGAAWVIVKPDELKKAVKKGYALNYQNDINSGEQITLEYAVNQAPSGQHQFKALPLYVSLRKLGQGDTRQKNIAKFLIQQGADPFIKNKETGLTLVETVKQTNNIPAIQLFKELGYITSLRGPCLKEIAAKQEIETLLAEKSTIEKIKQLNHLPYEIQEYLITVIDSKIALLEATPTAKEKIDELEALKFLIYENLGKNIPLPKIFEEFSGLIEID